jgi:flagellar motor switch protein FliN/FliY
MEKTQSYSRYSKIRKPKSANSENKSGMAEIESTFCGEKVDSHEPPKQLAFFHDVPLTITAELGRCAITIRKLLGLVPGSILTLTDEPQVQVTVRANGNEVAKGEVVTVNEHFGVRITEIKDQGE